MNQVFLYMLIIAMSFQSTTVKKQKTEACCTSSTTQFASFGSDKNFVAMHEVPLKSNAATHGKMISYPTAAGKNANAYLVTADKKTDNYILVFHEWWGLNDWIKQMSDMLADSLKNVNVLALDLYEGQVAATDDQATKLMQSITQERAQAIIKGAVKYAGENSKIATIGWCMGGGWSMQGALIADDHTKGCVMYYGMPETDMGKLKGLNSDVLFIWAKKDQWINEKVKNDFIANMKAAGKTLTIKEYDADHAFANPSNPHHDSAAAIDAQKNTISYLRKVFRS